jgi:hypothetical protein
MSGAANRTLIGVFGAAGPFGVCAVHEENGEVIESCCCWRRHSRTGAFMTRRTKEFAALLALVLLSVGVLALFNCSHWYLTGEGPSWLRPE